MTINLKTHFCLVERLNGDSLTYILSRFRFLCNGLSKRSVFEDDISSLQSLSDRSKYVYFFAQLNGSWQRSGVYCHQTGSKLRPVFVSRLKFPIYNVSFCSVCLRFFNINHRG